MSSSGTPKDSSCKDVGNLYMEELRMHPKELMLIEGELQIKDVQGPKGEGSLEDRMEKLEQEVFNYKKMAEREVDIFHKIVCLNSLLNTRRRLQSYGATSSHFTTPPTNFKLNSMTFIIRTVPGVYNDGRSVGDRFTVLAVTATKDHGGPTINFNQFLEKENLNNNGSNFADWFRHVRIVLTAGNVQYVLDAPLGPPPAEDALDEVKNVYQTRKIHYSQVQCAILYGLEAELQKWFETDDPCEIVRELKAIFETHAAVESYEASKHFFGCMMEEGSSVSEHVLKMSGHAKKLNDLGIVSPNQLGIHRVLQSLPPSYKNFVMNYNMQNMNKELPELFSMLKSAEVEIQKEHQVLMVNKTTSFKKQGKPNKKGNFKKGGKKAAAPPKKPKAGPKPDTVCYYYKEEGH
ncbi:hypothetical protein QYE76_026906 [Lolium multiflorum]|uniref:Uncharacterized protein n=1 Tax=Lolium multiflorum TaxID=4521 RepID=A0AAD8RKK6_LOLMU|nr:hypothetical protein QYE76_026906 [Lolium multiflorum]